jgi:hypothetical protein
MKFAPVTVSVRSALPSAALAGDSDVMASLSASKVMTVKITASVTATTSALRMPLDSPAKVRTNTFALPGLVSRAAGTTAMSCVLLMNCVANFVLTPFIDHTTSLAVSHVGHGGPAKFAPPTASVRSALPAGTLSGTMRIRDDSGVTKPGVDPHPARLAHKPKMMRLAVVLVGIIFSINVS